MQIYGIGKGFALDRRSTNARDNPRMMPPRPPFTVVRLSDHGGQYVMILKCECGHRRSPRPQTLAALAGWDALLADVVRRLRCSRCGRRGCSAKARPETSATAKSLF
jgi:hypothetical protein